MSTLVKANFVPAAVATVTNLPAVRPPSLDELAMQFRREHGTVAGGIRLSVKAQVECGSLLEQMQAKLNETVGPGYWSIWVEDKCGVTLRQVQRYIAKAQEFREVSEKLGDATAMSLLSTGAAQKGVTSSPKAKPKTEVPPRPKPKRRRAT